MRVLTHVELEGALARSGIGTAVDQQRAALAGTDVEVLTSACRAREADVIHCNTFGPSSVALGAYARRTGTPLVHHAHTTGADFRESFRGSNLVAPALARYLRWFHSRADLVLAPSEYTRSRLDAYPVDAPVRPVSNGVDHDSLAAFEGLRGDYRDRYDLDGFVVFALGNAFERKGLSTFCRLAQRLDHEFAWFGPYDTGPQASAHVRQWTRNPPENVTFTGWVEDKRGAFAAGDAFCFPAHEENQGIAVLEAMACGKPVVLRDLPVFHEQFADGHDCLLRDSEEAFADALDRLADDPDLRERLGANARETAAEHRLDRVGDELADIYRDLVE